MGASHNRVRRVDPKSRRNALLAPECTRCLTGPAPERSVEAEALRLTRTAPLYYFGTTVGLIAAVAGHGFDDLATRLRRLRDSGEPSEQLLRDFAVAYAEFALRRPHLYRAMHAPELWHAESGLDAPSSRANEDGMAKARRWIQGAVGARLAAFKEVELAVETAQAAGRVRTDPREQTGASARLLTAIVDGFLFHCFAEQVGAGKPRARLLAELDVLVARAFSGLRMSRRDPRPDLEPQDERVTTGTYVNRPSVGATLLEERPTPPASTNTGRRRVSAPARH